MTLKVSLQHTFDGFSLDVDFEAEGGLCALFGPSGSGKSTIIRAISGLLKPQAGRIEIAGTTLFDRKAGIDLPVHKRRIGVIFQDARLFPHMNVRQNLAYGRLFSPHPASRDDFDRITDLLGLRGLLGRRTGDLSGGERQRVAIGRALLSSPRILLADEPLAALDEARKGEILTLFERVRDEARVPVVYVTHSPTEVVRLARHVVALRNGKVTATGSAASVLSSPQGMPLGPRATGSVIDARIMVHHDDGVSELHAGGIALFVPRVPLPVGAGVRLLIDAQDVILSPERPQGLSALNIIAGRIAAVHAGEGPGALISLETAAGLILARVTQRSVAALKLEVGHACHAIVKGLAILPYHVARA